MTRYDEMCLAYLWYYPFNQTLPNSNGCLFNNFDLATYEISSIVPDPQGGGKLPIALCDIPGGIAVADPRDPSQISEVLTCNTAGWVNGQPVFLEGEEASTDLSSYPQSKVLEDGFEAFWSFDEANSVLHMASKVRTDGWVGLGFGRGAMAGSDVVLGWVEEGGGYHFTDRFADSNGVPGVDDSFHYFEISVHGGVCDEGGGSCVWGSAFAADGITPLQDGTVLLGGGSAGMPEALVLYSTLVMIVAMTW